MTFIVTMTLLQCHCYSVIVTVPLFLWSIDCSIKVYQSNFCESQQACACLGPPLAMILIVTVSLLLCHCYYVSYLIKLCDIHLPFIDEVIHNVTMVNLDSILQRCFVKLQYNNTMI